jgi:hypothetical protein
MLIGEIERNATERVRISTESYKGRDYLDVRIYYQDNNGEWKPTKKGVTISPEKIDELSELVKKASEELKKK